MLILLAFVSDSVRAAPQAPSSRVAFATSSTSPPRVESDQASPLVGIHHSLERIVVLLEDAREDRRSGLLLQRLIIAAEDVRRLEERAVQADAEHQASSEELRLLQERIRGVEEHLFREGDSMEPEALRSFKADLQNAEQREESLRDTVASLSSRHLELENRLRQERDIYDELAGQIDTILGLRR